MSNNSSPSVMARLLTGLKSITLAPFIFAQKKSDVLEDTKISHIYNRLTESEKTELDNLAEEVHFKKGDLLISENEPASKLFLIHQGSASVYKTSTDNEGRSFEHHIFNIDSGSLVGLMPLVDEQNRSANVKAESDIVASCYPYALIKKNLKLYGAICRSASLVFSQQLRHTNEKVVAALKSELATARAKNVLGMLMIAIFWFICVYTILLTTIIGLSDLIPNTTPISVALIIIMVVLLVFVVLKSDFPPKFFGLTLDRWKEHIIEAFVYSLIICLVITLAKWVAIHGLTYYKGKPLFDPSRDASLNGHFNLGLFFISLFMYALFCPAQEFITRCVLQTTFYKFLPGGVRTRKWNSIILSNLLFSTTHSHVTLLVALVVFLPGLFWGWLFHRQRSLVGVAVSHTLIGVYVMIFLTI